MNAAIRDQAAHLFAPFTQRDVTLRHRIAVSPMDQYSAEDGFATDWHLVHLGSRAVGGAALVMTEAAAVEARGRISLEDLGIWKDAHAERLARVTRFVRAQGAVAAIQLAHAGRKAGTRAPWTGSGVIPVPEGGWQPVAPSPIPFHAADPAPIELGIEDIAGVVASFRAAAARSLAAGFQVAEIHAAHGYLAHEFLSPLSNQRQDQYGGSFENRIRFVLETIAAVREVWPERLPLWLRISATDWVPGCWDIDQSVELARRVGPLGVDLVDCSSGGLSADQKIPLAPGYQVAFAARIRREAGIATGAVGLITTPRQADQIVRSGQGDVVLLAREMLRDPYFPLHAARALGVEFPPPKQYLRAF